MRNVEYETNYLVFDDGRIWSKQRNKFMSLQITKRGYHRIWLNKKPFSVHRLVAINFIKNPDNKPCVNHKDGNPLNNHYTNLEWVTHSENTKHSYDILKRKINYNFNNIKLTKNEVYKIRKSKLSLTELANIYNCSIANIHKIKTYKSWK